MTRTISLSLIAGAALFFVQPAQAHDYTAGSLKIDHPWARATPKGASVGAGYMKITNNGKEPDRLVGGTSNVSARFEIHQMSMANGVMTMRMLDTGVEIKPGQTVELGPNAFHLMFSGLKQQLNKGDRIKGTLIFEKAGKVDVDFVVEGIGAMNGGDDHGMPGMQMKH